MGVTGGESIPKLVCLELAQGVGRVGERRKKMKITGYGDSPDPEPGRSQCGQDSDSPPLRLVWAGRHKPRGNSRGWCPWLCLAAWASGGVWGLCLWTGVEESEGKRMLWECVPNGVSC